MDNISKKTLLVGQTIIYRNGVTKVTGGVVLNREVKGYSLKFVPLDTTHKYINGIIDKTGVHIDYVVDHKIPTYNYNEVSKEFISVDNNYMIVGYCDIAYYVLCNTTIVAVERKDIHSIEELQHFGLIGQKDEAFFIERTTMCYIYQNIVNFDVLNHSEDETRVYKVEWISAANGDELMSDGVELSTFDDAALVLLPYILRRAKEMGYNYRFDYIDNNNNFFSFEYKHNADHLVLYGIYVFDDDLNVANSILDMFGKEIILNVEGYENEVVTLQLCDVQLYRIRNYHNFNIEADSVRYSTNGDVEVSDVEVLDITARDIDSRLIDIDSYCRCVKKVNINFVED